ncbi:hypothetical protein Ocin01_10217 [Orchesella cincta]|uniref:Uncharacterized protein n=1 Tax=Orchesella cincta TaxID=48709 RepID=A0A1D2MUH4_ORCCI|nr:hypothetical protein Ocin01_10217 [Orchesella cincta]
MGYEYPNETAWNTDENGTAVNWNFLTFAYASCDLYVGTICEPTDLKHEPKCNWRKGWTANYELAINYTAVTEFGFNGSGLYRSTYKQQFGQHICQIPILQNIKDGVDYEISLDTLDYHAITEKKLREEVMHYYDYLEPYWVVDHTREENDWFQNATKDVEECLVSQAVKIDTTSDDQIAFRREVKKVNCLEWHFYLCGPEEFDSWAHDEL